MDDFGTYLKKDMGLPVVDRAWAGADELPLFLATAASYRLCSCSGVDFIAALVGHDASLPELKRIASQVSERAGMPTVLVAQIGARQRSALVQQGIPFVVPNRQASLPMLGFAAKSRRDPAPLSKRLAPGVQAILVTLIARPELCMSEELMDATGMPASSISRALEDLARRGLVKKARQGHALRVERTADRNDLLRNAMGCLRSPSTRVLYARKDARTSLLPFAGESALAERSMLAAPNMEQRAIAKRALGESAFEEVCLGELSDGETVQIQVWSYDPLVAGGRSIDDVSLALTLAEEGDERVIGQLNELFEEELWQ